MSDGDVVAITGASSGIGRATARKFGEDGARVGLLARGEDGLAAVADERRWLPALDAVLAGMWAVTGLRAARRER